MDLVVETNPSGKSWSVGLTLHLDGRETSELFLAGDKLISWPTEGMVAGVGQGPFRRSSMYLSEVVSRDEGLELLYETEEQAQRVAGILSYQVREAFPEAFPEDR